MSFVSIIKSSFNFLNHGEIILTILYSPNQYEKTNSILDQNFSCTK